MKLKGYEHMTFYTKKEFQKKYPKGAGGYTVIGSVGSGVGKGQRAETILADGELVDYYPYKAPGFWNEIYGYLQAGEKEYVYIAVQRSRVWKILLIFAAILAAAAAVVFALPKGADQDSGLAALLDSGSRKHESDLEVPDNEGQKYITLPGFNHLYIMAGEDTINAEFWNPDGNPCYFKYAIRLKDTGEVIYESGYIEPGNAVTEQTLNRTFERGTYPIVISITTYDLVEYEQQLNGGEIEATLVAMVEGEEKQD